MCVVFTLSLAACHGGSSESVSPGSAQQSEATRSSTPNDASSNAAETSLPPKSTINEPLSADIRPPGVLYRDEISRATHNGRPAYLLQQLQPRAFRPKGRFIGWEITHLFPDDPSFCQRDCFLRVGDVIVDVNGSNMEHPEAYVATLESIQTQSSLRVRLLRDGMLLDRRFRILERSDPS